jgi:hypothetical protein
MNHMWEGHQRKKRKCSSLERNPNSDWVTCTHVDNPTALGVCSHEHCSIVSLCIETKREV